MNYDEFDVNDFALDIYFNEWVKSPTEETNQFWESWLAEHTEKKSHVEIARQIIYAIHAPSVQLGEIDSRQLWNDIKRRNEAAEQFEPETDIIPIGSRFKWFRLQNIAASVALLITLSGLFWIFNNGKPEMVSYHTNYGEIKVLTLPDSSKVFLNANSTLTIAQQWDESADRQVTLEGEAFFEVTKKHGRGDAKFRVHSGDIQVEVLGTEFNVYSRRKKVQVVLQEGSVQLSAPRQNHKVRMLPGDLVEYSALDAALNRMRIDPARYSSWTKHELVFDDTPLTDVAHSVEDILNFKIIFEDDSFKTLPFTGTLSFANPDELVTVLSKSFNIKITRSNNTIFFHRK